MHRFWRFHTFPSQLAPTSGAMGYGVPAAVAAKAVHPERTVVCFSGDGDFLMHGSELATAVQHDLPIVVLVVDNGMYGTIRMHQERHYPGRVVGTDLRNPDFAAYARAFGAHGELVERTEDVPRRARARARRRRRRRCSRCASTRRRSRRARRSAPSAPVADPFNALVTEVEPEPARPGPLAGLRLAVKDLIDTAGIRTTYGSRIYADHVPERTATAVERLVAAGAIVTAKANLHEFAWGVTSQNPWYGTVQNPHLPGRTTGGSSGGNAAAIAAGLADVGLGTDTGGSIRLPAACCGVVGLKPSWGRIPVDGVFPLCPTFDTVGADGAHGSRGGGDVVGARRRAAPGAAARGPHDRAAAAARRRSAGRRCPANDAAEAYVERLEELGARVVEATIPEPPADTWPLFFHEAAASHRDTYPERADEYGDNVRAKLELAQTVEPRRRRRCARGGRRVARATGRRSTCTSRRRSASRCRRSTATSSTCGCR